MDAAQDAWAKIKAAYLAEGDYAAIATGRELGIRTLAIIPRIREWKAEVAAAPPPIAPSKLLSIEVLPRSALDTTVDTFESVQRHQQRLTTQLGASLEHELLETQMMSKYASSFVDADHIELLRAKAMAGDSKPLIEYLLNATKARRLLVEHIERLARAINQHLQAQRAVWKMDDPSKKGENETNWEAILSDLRKPLAPLVLPANVIDFERKLRRSAEGTKRGA